MTKVLIVDDDLEACRALGSLLRDAGFSTTTAVDGKQALESIVKSEPTLVLLDLYLPDIDGLEIIRRTRLHSKVPILVISGRGSAPEIALGLELGADDYIVKPIHPEELLARIRAVLRRIVPDVSKEPIERAGLLIDPGRREVWLQARLIETTTLEFNLIHFLASQPSRVFSRKELVKRVWRTDRYIELRAVDNLVGRLRHKLEADSSKPRRLVTVWGAGYRLDDPPSVAPRLDRTKPRKR